MKRFRQLAAIIAVACVAQMAGAQSGVAPAKQLFRELLTYMIESPQNVSRALHLLLIARNLERIADHATNVAEDVIFFVEGRDIRHSLRPVAG